MTISIRSERVLVGGAFASTSLTIADGMIAALDAGAARELDARDLLVLPGIVDLHGDAFERQVMPRPGVQFPIDAALLDNDRQMAANGITTGFLSVTHSWEPGLRSSATLARLMAALERLRPRFACDTRLHLRHEAYHLDGAADVARWLPAGAIDLLAFNDHTPAMIARAGDPLRLSSIADRTGLDATVLGVELQRLAARGADVAGSTARLAGIADAAGVPMASHDDETPDGWAQFHALGCTICEFPKTADTARGARASGAHVVMGAPNVVRGGSHLGLVTARDMVASGACDVLASDYYYAALPLAPFALAADRTLALADAWALVSTNPAQAARLHDRGVIAAGARADLVCIDDRLPGPPAVVAALAAGRLVHFAGDPARWSAAAGAVVAAK
jgi:alpha-D-ribose 1-methylphosphonate 5-triphosphate diphosphatase